MSVLVANENAKVSSIMKAVSGTNIGIIVFLTAQNVYFCSACTRPDKFLDVWSRRWRVLWRGTSVRLVLEWNAVEKTGNYAAMGRFESTRTESKLPFFKLEQLAICS
jgi:hypothetical protein